MKKLFMLVFLCFAAPVLALAYVPGLAAKEGVVVDEPLFANVYFGELREESQVFRFELASEGKVYLNLLTPARVNRDGKFDAVLVNESRGTITAVLEAGNLPWQSYYDRALGEEFLQGPELTMDVPSGKYRVVVTSTGNLGKYVLRIGSVERFSISDYYTLYKMGPSLKRDFFNMSSLSFAKSSVGLVFSLCYLLLGTVVGYGIRRSVISAMIMKWLFGKSFETPMVHFMLGITLFILGISLLLISLAPSWNIAILLLAGCMFFGAFVSAVRVIKELRVT